MHETELLCNINYVFAAPFDHFSVSLHKSINFFQKIKKSY